MAEAVVSSKNQIVIPKEARDALHLKPGDKLQITVRGDRVLLLKKPRSYRSAIRGLAEGPWPEEFLDEERESWR